MPVNRYDIHAVRMDGSECALEVLANSETEAVGFAKQRNLFVVKVNRRWSYEAAFIGDAAALPDIPCLVSDLRSHNTVKCPWCGGFASESLRSCLDCGRFVKQDSANVTSESTTNAPDTGARKLLRTKTKAIVAQYRATPQKAMTALPAIISRLGYTLEAVDKENGIISFETGMSWYSWAGQKMSVHVLDVDEGEIQVTMGGTMKAHGAQIQVYDWGEARKIATKVFTELDELLGPGKLISGSFNSGSCYVVTATFGEHSQEAAMVLARCRRRFLLNPLLFFGWCAYKYYGPILAYWSQTSPIGYLLCKCFLADPIVFATSDRLLVSALAMLYLAVLSLIGSLLLLPCMLVGLVLRACVAVRRSHFRAPEKISIADISS